MCVRQKVEEYIIFAQGQHSIVYAEPLTVLTVSKHHTFALSCSTTGIKDITQVVVVGISLTLAIFGFKVVVNAAIEGLF